VTKLFFAILTIGVLSSPANAQLKPTSLTGTWQLTETKITGPDARTISNVAGLLIFTGTHYSRIYIASDIPRKAIKDPNSATAAELLSTWGPFVAASGTYDIDGDTVNLRPLIAKNPQVMAPGVDDVFSFKLKGKILAITSVRNAGGAIKDPTTFTFTRVE
jgi:hypothetical protein